MLIGWNTSNRSLQLYASVALFSIIFLTIEEILEEDGKGNTKTPL